MKKLVLILAIVVLVLLAIYVGANIYTSNKLNNVPKPLAQALDDIKTPAFTIDVFPDNTVLPTIKTTVQADLDAISGLDNLNNDDILNLYDQWNSDGATGTFEDYLNGN